MDRAESPILEAAAVLCLVRASAVDTAEAPLQPQILVMNPSGEQA